MATALSILRGGTDCALDGSTHAARLIATGQLKLDDVLVARDSDQVCGAVFAQKLPGSTGILWPAQSLSDDGTVDDALTAAALQRVDGVKVVLAFLSANEMGRSNALLRAGFRQVTEILEMQHQAAPTTPDPSGVSLIAHADADVAVFRQMLLQCHDESLDCPELNEVRTADEILEGYRDCAPDMSQWWIAEYEGRSIGILILNTAVLAFVGVVPERRGEKLGRQLVQCACKMSPELSLVVDVRNTPAVQLYLSLGFVVVGTRRLFLKLMI